MTTAHKTCYSIPHEQGIPPNRLGRSTGKRLYRYSAAGVGRRPWQRGRLHDAGVGRRGCFGAGRRRGSPTGNRCRAASAETTLALLDPRLQWLPQAEDGQPIEKGLCVGTIEGPARALLAAERTLLNLLGRLSGVATLTRQYVDLVATMKARIYDTRKTTPGWRRLEKYAVRCGGGWNHRGGLGEAILIKDNHLALAHRGLSQFSRAPRRSRGRRKWDCPPR